MKNLKELKREQYSLKAKLHEVIELINSEEYFTLSSREKSLISQQRTGMEIYLNALTNRLYGKDTFSMDSSSLLFPFLTSMFSTPLSPSSFTSLKEEDKKDEEKDKLDLEQTYVVPV